MKPLLLLKLCIPIFAGAACVSAQTQDVSTTASPTFAGLTVTKSTMASGNSFLGDFRYSGTPGVGDVPFAIRGLVTNNGTNLVANGEHMVGVLGWAVDAPSGTHNLLGLEGKVDAQGNSTVYMGVSGDAGYTGSHFTGTLYGFGVTRLQVMNVDNTPLNEGTVVGYYCPPITGGAQKFTLMGSNDVALLGSSFRAFGSTGKSIQIYHDGSAGKIEAIGDVGIGSLNGGYTILLPTTAGLVPATDGQSLGIATPMPLRWSINGTTGLYSGNVGIGTTAVPTTNKLEVNGTIKAKEIVVETSGFADYVFSKDYKLEPLNRLAAEIEKEGHLPGIPSASQVAEHGISVGELQTKLLAKVEELTLHIIAQQKEIDRLSHQNDALAHEVRELREHH